MARLAAVETALLECAQLGATEIVVGDSVPDHVLDRMRPIEGARFIRETDIGADDAKRGYCGIGGEPVASMREQDFSGDIVLAMERFPIFPASGEEASS